MIKLIIIRHGYSIYNKERRFTGQADIPLDNIGEEQALDTAKYILSNFKVDAVYSSDLQRAIDTVTPIADALGVPVVKCKGLRELNVGKWQGMKVDDVAQKFPESYNLFKNNVGRGRPDGGESYEELMERAVKTVYEIADENPNRNVVIGTHGGVIRVLRAFWTGCSLDGIKDIAHVPNSSISIVELDREKCELVTVGYNQHLNSKITEERLK